MGLTITNMDAADRQRREAANAAAVAGAEFRVAEIRRQAAAAAMLPPVPPPVPPFAETAASVEHLVDRELLAQTTERVHAARRQMAEAVAGQGRANVRLAAAEKARDDLAAATAAGQPHTQKAVNDVTHELHDAGQKMRFARDVVNAAQREIVSADEAQMHAMREAHRPVLDYGVNLRIAAAGRLDAAKLAVATAERDWTIACDVVTVALQRGVKLPHHVGVASRVLPRSEAAERMLWRRPAEWRAAE